MFKVELAQKTISTLYPNAPSASASATYDWGADPWSRGSYCYFAPGNLKNWRSELPYFAGRVIFAGEHTAEIEYCGYLEGAIRSRQRAADQILAFQE
ncbi:MAG: FAD-dependent oxidoreductase [Nostoc sp. DedQUE01]